MSFLYGTSRHKFYTVSNITHGVLTLILTSVLIGPLGLMGVALGVAIPNLLIKFALQPLYVCRALNIRPAEWYFRYVLRDYAVPLGYLAAVGVLSGPSFRPATRTFFSSQRSAPCYSRRTRFL